MSGAVKSECRACTKIFASVKAFDFHRTGAYEPNTRHCMTTVEMRAAGMFQDSRGWWTIPASTKKLVQTQKSA